MKAWIAFASTALLAPAAFAGLLTLKTGTATKEGIAIPAGATIAFQGQNADVETVASGVRAKKVLVANLKVYVAQLMVSTPARFSKADALATLEDNEVAVMRLSFVRSVTAEQLQVSFQDAMVANKINLKEPAMAGLLKAVIESGGADQGQSIAFATLKKSDGNEVLAYEGATGKVTFVEGPRGLTKQIFSMWLGVPADDGLQKLKSELLK